MSRISISSGAKWEYIVGYSRAVRLGNLIEVSGTTAVGDDRIIGEDVYTQANYILQKIKTALEQAGGRMEDVVRTRIYVTDISQWEAVAKAHREHFGTIKPATSMVEVSGLIHPDMLVEIEATAVVEQV